MADENKYSSWIELLKTVTSIKVLLKKLNVTPQTEGRFWQDLLALLQSEEAPFDCQIVQRPTLKLAKLLILVIFMLPSNSLLISKLILFGMNP